MDGGDYHVLVMDHEAGSRSVMVVGVDAAPLGRDAHLNVAHRLFPPTEAPPFGPTDGKRNDGQPSRQLMSASDGGYILIIEDDAGVREGLVAVIESEGYPVIGYEDAQVALDSLSSGDLPRMIMLDFMLPGMDGWMFLAERKKDARLRDIPVLGMSASQLLTERREAPAGVDEFLKKPFKVETMLRSIEKYWRVAH